MNKAIGMIIIHTVAITIFLLSVTGFSDQPYTYEDAYSETIRNNQAVERGETK